MEKLKSIAKIVGIVLGIFILWIAFAIFSDGKPSTTKKTSLSLPMSAENKIGSLRMAPGMELMEDAMIETDMVDQGMMMNESFSSGPVMTEKKVIKNGNLTLKVESTEKSAEKVSQIAKAQGGEVFSTNFYERVKGQKSGTITIKVPVDKFEETVEKLKDIATQVVSESTTGQDVTEQYADLQAQLKNKKAEEESFVKILDRAGDIEDVLAVTKQISRVRGEIERLEGRIRFMDSQTDMSTIVVSISEDIEIAPIQNDWRPWQVVKKSFSDLIATSQNFIDGLIRFVIVGIPSLLPAILFVWILYWAAKKIWRKIKE